ncbi:DUF2971 domain-containing protein [Aliarcobacter butzleri]|uniref:DUF2971 domain-containing protein n=1 Tax=Aliarcobacter butzleri TaxID=28197 RepID=UPI0021B32BBD|nr:DUF2971 domain-containing protein [Aliarcobacter butzleri]MCT7646592.1 DUF2971 domain-containing protein [Aliarcobacter butzleri]MDS1315665.1 DUF2971 domain-containing protein [Aliarcobacter butzleri]
MPKRNNMLKQSLNKDLMGLLHAQYSCHSKKNVLEIFANQNKFYHYTTIDGFKGIIESNGLWLSEAKYLNDKEEIINGKNKAIEVINFLMKEKKKYKIFSDILNGTIEKLNSLDFSNKYICSFSLKFDDLDQWRAYGKNGSGICIEFTRDKEKYTLFEIFNFIKFAKVIYNDKRKYKILHRIIFIYFYYYCFDLKKGNYIDKEDYIDFLVSNLSFNFILFKNQAFQSEKEIRLIYTGNPIKSFTKKSFRVSNNIIVPFINLADSKTTDVQTKKLLAQEQKLPITKVCIGPISKQEAIMEASIKEFLEFYGHSKDIVITSKIPYR